MSQKQRFPRVSHGVLIKPSLFNISSLIKQIRFLLFANGTKIFAVIDSKSNELELQSSSDHFSSWCFSNLIVIKFKREQVSQLSLSTLFHPYSNVVN